MPCAHHQMPLCTWAHQAVYIQRAGCVATAPARPCVQRAAGFHADLPARRERVVLWQRPHRGGICRSPSVVICRAAICSGRASVSGFGNLGSSVEESHNVDVLSGLGGPVIVSVACPAPCPFHGRLYQQWYGTPVRCCPGCARSCRHGPCSLCGCFTRSSTGRLVCTCGSLT